MSEPVIRPYAGPQAPRRSLPSRDGLQGEQSAEPGTRPDLAHRLDAAAVEVEEDSGTVFAELSRGAGATARGAARPVAPRRIVDDLTAAVMVLAGAGLLLLTRRRR